MDEKAGRFPRVGQAVTTGGGPERVCPLHVRDEGELRAELARIGCDPRALPYFEAKRRVLCLRISDMDVRGANVLKQEALARGADAAIHARCVDGGVRRSDALLLGTPKQLDSLLQKLAEAPYFGLSRAGAAIREALDGLIRPLRPMELSGGRCLDFGSRSLLMGIVNLTPDSFYDGSRVPGAEAAADRALRMVREGADLLDLGAESTRPGSDPVPEEEERERLIPAVAAVRAVLPEIPVSVDTNKASVAAAAIEAGADIVNDIAALGDPEMRRIVAESGVPVILMHMKGVPRTMQEAPIYEDVLGEVRDFLAERIDLALRAGIRRDRIVLDPGIGFGKRREDNLILLRHLEVLQGFGMPLLVGHSRKSFLGKIAGSSDPADRLEETLAVTAHCAAEGVEILRVHDVRANLKVIRTAAAIRHGETA
jgi:dihydropteroate synthase